MLTLTVMTTGRRLRLLRLRRVQAGLAATVAVTVRKLRLLRRRQRLRLRLRAQQALAVALAERVRRPQAASAVAEESVESVESAWRLSVVAAAVVAAWLCGPQPPRQATSSATRSWSWTSVSAI
jgi:hypothetical protein